MIPHLPASLRGRTAQLFLLLATCTVLSGQEPAVGSWQTLSGFGAGTPEQVDLHDLDNDGDLDVLVRKGGGGVGFILWKENLGGGGFGTTAVLSFMTNTFFQRFWDFAAGDFDGDGDSDVVISRGSDIVWKENLGGGAFAPQQVLALVSAGNRFRDIDLGDMDSDGLLDLLVTIDGLEVAAWYPNLGGAMLGARAAINNLHTAHEWIAPADIDGDGDLDVVVSGFGPTPIMWHENLGGGIFGPGQVLAVPIFFPFNMRVVDLDRDGDVDVLYTSESEISWRENLGGGAFAPHAVLVSDNGFSNGVRVTDFDQDGDLDILINRGTTNECVWYENHSGLAFGPADVLSSQLNGLRDLAVGDLDGDEDLDVVVAGFFPGGLNWAPSYLGLHESSLLHSTLQVADEQLGRSLASLGDLDADATPDLVAGAPAWESDRGRVRAWSPESGQTLWVADGAGAGERFGEALSIAGDLDGDGVGDVVVSAPQAQSGFGEVRVLCGASGATLMTLLGAAPGEEFGATISGGVDIDGDGIPDLAVGVPGHDGPMVDAGEVRIYSGVDGSLLAVHGGAVAGERLGQGLLLIADQDGDGRGEVVVAHRPSGGGSGALVMFGGMTGTILATFSPPTATGEFGRALAFVPQLGTSSQEAILVGDPAAVAGSGGAWVLSPAFATLRTHTGTLGAALGTSVSAAGDVNGDGAADYLLGAPGYVNAEGVRSGRVVILDGDTGLELNALLVSSGLSPEAFEGGARSGFGSALSPLGDLDGDGFAEFVVGLPGRSRVWVYGGLNPVGLYGPCASGTASEPLLFVDGSAGGVARRVSIPVGDAFTLSVAQPSANPLPAYFAIAGYLGMPQAGQETTLPFASVTLCLPPVGVDPASFILTNNFASYLPQLVTSTPTPWSLGITGIPVPFVLTFQGLIIAAPGELETTNAVVAAIVP